jgi:exopolysaccharide biosynthesis predicted pyruvyltransferase EpsI
VKLLTPRYPGKSTEELLADSHLKSLENFLRNSKKIRVFHNIDDFLVTEKERIYLDEVLKDRLTWFSNGGHLGNLYYRTVLDAIVKAGE